MHVFIPVIISFLITSAGEMSQATTGEFRRCFPEWVNASKVTVSCKKENDTNASRIAQYCDDQTENCPKMNKPGVSLEKDQDGFCLTITNDTYDSWSCEAQSYINENEQKENFTVDFSNQPNKTSSNQETDDNSLNQEHINTSPGPDTSPISVQRLIGVIIGSIVSIVLIVLIGLCIYKKKQLLQKIRNILSWLQMKFSRKTTSHPNRENQQDMEMGENEPMQDRVSLENEVLGENRENGETLALGQNGRQERRQAKKIAPCAT